jgi:hypothetical protein
MKLGKKLKIKGTKLTAEVVGKAMVQEDGKIVEKQVILLDTSTTTLQEIFPYLKMVVVDSSILEE